MKNQHSLKKKVKLLINLKAKAQIKKPKKER
jgi:hypothetical protein